MEEESAKSVKQQGEVAASKVTVLHPELHPEKTEEKEANQGNTYRVGGYISDVIKGYHEPAKGLFTGYENIDEHFGRLLTPGDMIVGAARPGAGKSVFGVGCSHFHAANNRNVLMWSLEMSKEQLVERMISAYTGISVKRLRNRAIEPTEWSLIHETGNSLCSLPLWVNDLSSASVQEIRGESISLHNKLKKQNGQVLDLIVVDYLQLATTDEGRSREQEVAEISRALRALAKDLQVPILVLAQLNRELEKRANKRPILSDLRESGQIEQDASVVFFLHRESLYCDECMDPELTCTKGHEHDAEFIVAKNRAGERGLVRLRFNGARQTFAPCQKAPNEYTDRVLRTETTKTSLSKQRLKRNGFNANI